MKTSTGFYARRDAVLIGRPDRLDGDCYLNSVSARWVADGSGKGVVRWVTYDTPAEATKAANSLDYQLSQAESASEHNAIIERWFAEA